MPEENIYCECMEEIKARLHLLNDCVRIIVPEKVVEFVRRVIQLVMLHVRGHIAPEFFEPRECGPVFCSILYFVFSRERGNMQE